MSRKARLLTRLLSLLAVIIPTSVILTPQPASAGTCYQMSNGYWVCNAIMNKYFGLGGWNWAYPVTNETGTSDGIGAYNHFNEWVSGRPSTASIYWTEATGTWKVNGAIRDKWGWMGWERSPLGYPTGDESDPAYTPITQRFQNGMIVFTPERGPWKSTGRSPTCGSTWATSGASGCPRPTNAEHRTAWGATTTSTTGPSIGIRAGAHSRSPIRSGTDGPASAGSKDRSDTRKDFRTKMGTTSSHRTSWAATSPV